MRLNMANSFSEKCCGKTYVASQMVFRSSEEVEPPCTPTETEVLPELLIAFDPGVWAPYVAGTTSIGSGALVCPQDDEGDDGINDSWVSDIPVIDQSKDHVFSFDFVRTLVNFSAPTTRIAIQTATHYFDITGLEFESTGLYSQAIAPGDWIAGNSPTWNIHSIAPQPNTILIDFATIGFPTDFISIDNLSLLEQDCI